MEFGLRKIVLIDSYVEGAAAELDVSGHTNISGGNGKGKTTFLRLIPIFYGESPRRLVTASGNGNSSFNEWYLPRKGSYLVFEYMSHGEPRMVVFCNRANETRHRHIFIDSAYREDLFMDVENTVIHPAHRLLEAVQRENLNHLNVDTTHGYRQILLDGTVPKAYHFSMVPRNSRMSQLTPLFTGMFKRDAQFADLSRVIQEYAMDKLDDDSRKILRGFSPHRDHLTTTLNQYDAYQALEKVKPQCETLKSLLDEHRAARKGLSASVVAAGTLHSNLGLCLRGYDEEIAQTERLRSEEQTSYQIEATRLSGLIDELDGTLGPKTVEKNRIEREYSAYEKAELPDWEKKLGTLDSKRAELAGLKTQHAALSNASDEIQKPIDREITQTKERAGAVISTLTKSRDAENSQHQARRNHLTASHATQVRNQNETHKCQWVAKQTVASGLEADVRVLQERISNPKPDPKLARQMEIADRNYQSAQSDFEEAQSEEGDAREAFGAAQSSFDLADRGFEKARNRLDEIENEHFEVQGLISGNENTLIHFLNTHRPGWEDTLGRILQPDILRRSNLSPAIDDKHSDAHSLYGVAIDHGKLPEQELTPAALTARLAELEASLATAEKDCTAAEKDLNQANNRLSEAGTRKGNAGESLRQAKFQLKSASDMLTQIRKQVEESLNKALQAAKQELEGTEKALADAHMELEKLEELQSAEQTELRKEQEAALEGFDEAHETRLNEIARQIKDAEETRDAEIERLKRQLDEAMSEKGIDPRELAALDQRCKALQREIDDIQGKAITIKGYRDFMDNDYASLDSLIREIEAVQADARVLKEQKRTLGQNWEAASRDFNRKIEDLQGAKRKDKSDYDALEIRVLNAEREHDLSVREDENLLSLYQEMAAEKLIDEYVRWLREEASLTSRVKKLSDQFAMIFEKHPGTPSTQYWQELGLEWDGTDHRTLARAKAMVEYFHGGKHDIVYESLVKGFGNLDQIDIYRRAMENFDGRIRRFNRELSQHMTQSLTFSSLSNIDPTVSFELEDLDYWKDIRSLADSVRAWREEAGINSMPNDELVRSLRSYLETFEVSRANVAVDELWRLIRFRFTVVENGKTKSVTGNRDLSGETGVSSNGLSYLILIVVFLGFVDMQRNRHPVRLSWALDELRAFDNDNKRALLELLSQHNINLVTACPDLEDRDLGIFHRVYQLEDSTGDLRFVEWEMPPARAALSENPFLEAAE